jgi:hypothetical protein
MQLQKVVKTAHYIKYYGMALLLQLKNIPIFNSVLTVYKKTLKKWTSLYTGLLLYCTEEVLSKLSV